jgi:hypothetical protein
MSILEGIRTDYKNTSSYLQHMRENWDAILTCDDGIVYPEIKLKHEEVLRLCDEVIAKGRQHLRAVDDFFAYVEKFGKMPVFRLKGEKKTEKEEELKEIVIGPLGNRGEVNKCYDLVIKTYMYIANNFVFYLFISIIIWGVRTDGMIMNYYANPPRV